MLRSRVMARFAYFEGYSSDSCVATSVINRLCSYLQCSKKISGAAVIRKQVPVQLLA